MTQTAREPVTAESVLLALEAAADPAQVPSVARFYKGGDPETRIKGVPIGQVFPIAKRYQCLPLSEIEKLLDDVHYEVRMAGVAILDFSARRARSEQDREALFSLYIRRHDRLDNWDLVDRAAPHVVGEYLVDKDRTVLDRLARSQNPNERRTAIVSTHAFLKRGDTADLFRIADLLADDPDPYVQKAIASWTREAGKSDPDALADFLRRNRSRLPRSTFSEASKTLPGKALLED